MARRLDEMTEAERRRLAALAVMDLHADEDKRSVKPKPPASTHLTGGGNTASPSAAAAQQKPKTQGKKQAQAKPNTKNGGAGRGAGASRSVGALLPPPSMTLPYAPKSADEQSLVQRSLLWHTAQTKVQKDELHRQNNEIRQRNGWRYDPQQGTTFDARGRNLTAPVATVQNPAQQARATQAGMMGLSPETFQQRTDALTGAGHYAETHQPRNLRETVLGRTSDEEADWARRTLAGLYSRPYNVWTPGEREDQRKAAELLTKHIKNRKSLGMTVDSIDATLDDASGRLRQALRSIGNTTVASVPLMVETFQQQAQNVENSRKNPEVVRLETEKALLEAQLASMPSVDGYGNVDPAYKQVYDRYREVENRLYEISDHTPVSPDTWASQKMTRAAQQRENALMGLSDAERFVGGAAISMADSASTLPLAAINPALSLAAMGTKSAAQKTHELNLRELPPGEAGLRGIVSGTVEVFTEKLPIENLLHTMKTGGKGFLKNLLRQAGIEGTEEAASELLNYAADVMAHDPEARLSLQDVASAFAGGVLSGMGFAGGGTALHYGSAAVADIMPRLTKADGSPRQNVDAARRAGYNQAAEGGVANVEGQMDHGRGRSGIPQNDIGIGMADDPAGLRGAESGSNETGSSAGGDSGIYGSDSEGRRIAPEVRERLNESAGDLIGAAAQPAIETVPGSTLGRNGAKAIVEYAPETDTARYAAAFHTYYEAGLAAQGLDTVRSVYDGALTDAQKKAAYYAGGKDYLASLESEKQAAGQATVYGTAESGVVENEYAAAVNQTEKAAVDYLARSLGVKVEFVPTVAEGRANGSIRDGVMQIALDAQDSTPVSVVAMHEITHRMQQLAPEAYRGFRDHAVRQMLAAEFTGETSQTLVEQYVERYGGTLTTEQAFDEIAADYTRELLTSRDAADALIQTDRTLAQKFMDTVKKLIKDLSAFVEGLKGDAKAAFRPELDELQQGYALWRDAFKAADSEVRTRRESGKTGVQSTAARDTIYSRKDRTIKLGRQEYTQVQSARMKKYGGMEEADIPTLDYVFAHDRFYVIQNSALDSFRAVVRIDPGKHQGDVTEIMEVLKNGGVRIDELVVALHEDLQRYRGRRNGDSGNTGNGRAAGRNAGLVRRTTGENQEQGKRTADRERDSRSGGEDRGTDGVRFSRESDLERTVETQRQTIERLREQFHRTKNPVVDRKAAGRIAAEVTREYSSKYDKAALADELRTLSETVLENRDKDGGFATAKAQAVGVAHKILAQSETLDDTAYREYAGLRKQLRETAVTLSDADRADLADRGGYDAFRKANFGRLKLTDGGMPVDTMYGQLRETYGNGLFPVDITHPADQLTQIADVLQSVQATYENPYSGNLREAADMLADELIDSLTAAPRQVTYADKQAAKLADVRAEYRQKARDALARERVRREDKIAEVKQYYQKRVRDVRTIRDNRELRGKIQKHVKKLSDLLVKPTDTKHVPEGLRKPVAEFLAAIDLTSGRNAEEPSARTLKLQALKDAYEQIGREGSEDYALVDPDLADNMQEILNLSGKRVADFGKGQLETLYKVVLAVESTVRNANRMFSEGRYKTVSDLGAAFIGENGRRKPRELYDSIDERPAWAREPVRKLTDKGIIQGEDGGRLGLTYDLMRLLVMNDRAGLYK